jgi:hypothetical protein
VIHDSLTDLDRTSLDRLKLAADVILGEGPNIPDPLTAELRSSATASSAPSSCPPGRSRTAMLASSDMTAPSPTAGWWPGAVITPAGISLKPCPARVLPVGSASCS